MDRALELLRCVCVSSGCLCLVAEQADWLLRHGGLVGGIGFGVARERVLLVFCE